MQCKVKSVTRNQFIVNVDQYTGPATWHYITLIPLALIDSLQVVGLTHFDPLYLHSPLYDENHLYHEINRLPTHTNMLYHDRQVV